MLSTKRFTTGIALALTALLMNAVLSVFAVYEIQRSVPLTTDYVNSEDVAESSVSKTVLVCTAEGLRWVSIAELIENPPSTSHSYYNCVFDYVSGCDDQIALPSAAPFRAPEQGVVVIRQWTHSDSLRHQIYARGIIPRAPPFFV